MKTEKNKNAVDCCMF